MQKEVKKDLEVKAEITSQHQALSGKDLSLKFPIWAIILTSKNYIFIWFDLIIIP